MKLSILFISCLMFFQSQAFQEFSYSPFNVYSENSRALIKDLREQKRAELEKQNLIEASQQANVYNQTTKYLVSLVKEKRILNDPGLDSLLYSISSRLTKPSPTIVPIKKILVKKDGFLNATSMGEGTIIINIGLIANAKSYDELAFILAHEIAHYHLNHLRKQIEKYLRTSSYEPVKRSIKKISSGKMTLEDLQLVQKWYNSFFMNSREYELEADSLALLMCKNGGFNFNAAKSVLEDLQFIYLPKTQLNSNLFDELMFKEVPFKERWIGQKRVVKNDNLMQHLLNNDSIKTHPHVSLRIKKISASKYFSSKESKELSRTLQRKTQFELINTFYQMRRYDFAIHVGLQLKEQYGASGDLDLQISRMLFEIAFAKNDRTLSHYVGGDASHYPNETRALNHFFFNLTLPEAAEISYLYTKENFDSNNPDFYRTLYKIDLLTNRLIESRALKKEFRKNFPGEDLSKYSDDEGRVNTKAKK